MKRSTIYFLIMGFVFIVIVGIVSNKNSPPLPAFVEEEEEIAVEEQKNVDLNFYVDEKTGYTIGIPAGWQYVLKNGFVTFVHGASSSSIQIQVIPYTPYLTSVSQDLLLEASSEEGVNITNFAWLTNHSYILTYEKDVNGVIYDYNVHVSFDLSNVIKTIYISRRDYNKEIFPLIDASAASISWESDKKIDERFMLSYNEYGNFEYGLPLNWNTDIQGSTFYAESPDLGMNISVSVTQSDVTYENISQVDYLSFVTQGRQNFNLQSFVSENGIINAFGTYKSGNTVMVIEQVLVATGSFEYALSMECPYEYYQDLSSYFEAEKTLFRLL